MSSEAELKNQLSPEFQRGLIGRFERYMDLERWQFRLSHVYTDTGRKVIYDSPWCRIKLSLLIDLRDGDEMHISYARSHVTNDVEFLKEWRGELCFAWHNIRLAPFWQFIEGYSVDEAAELDRAKARWPAYQSFKETELGATLQGVDWAVAFHGFVWDHYGERLFSLFDMRNPERWEEFRRYIKEFYRLRPYKPMLGDTSPPRHQVC